MAVRRRSKTLEVDGDLCRVVHPDRVQTARREQATQQEVSRLSALFSALSDPSRLKIAMALLSGEMCVYDLAAAVQMSESAVSHQLRRLRDRALVASRREGTLRYYFLDDAHVVELIRMGLDHVRE
ncbi:MAG: helix-turn-helix transcriptional regulator [Bradymonadales bacterium]|nr:helix-turn-helix transcriptional regulator [Bradymonadales bacterium]